jgi:hypothetical protein
MTTTTIDLPETSRVWIYQNKGPIPAAALPEIASAVDRFATQWVSHNQQMSAKGIILHNRFIVLIADESRVGAGGCSIDSSVHFIKSLEQQYGLDLFDRMTFSYRDGSGIHTVDRDTFSKRYQEGIIDDNTIVFDTLVNNKKALDHEFEKPLGQSWHQRMV